MRGYGLDTLALVRKVETILGQSFDISEADLAAIRLETVSTSDLSKAQMEAL